MPADRFVTPSGSVTLRRPGQNDRSPLQAWDAADSLALDHLVEHAASAEGAAAAWHVLVVNDAFGALALGLARADEPGRIWSWSDSAVAHDARRSNAAANDADPDAVVGLTTVEQVTGAFGTRASRVASLRATAPGSPPSTAPSVAPSDTLTPDVVIIKVPKALARLEYQLAVLSTIVGPDTVVIGAGMTRHIHTSTIEVFERILGPTRTTKAKHKARLILTDVDGDRAPIPVPDPVRVSVDAATVADGTGRSLTVWNQPGVFSQKRLDLGTRFLLQSLPGVDPAGLGESVRVVDLGCGNGVVGTVIARRNPDVELVFVDESALAVESARLTWHAAGFDAAAATFVHADATATDLGGLRAATADVVVLNPPFHDHQAIAVEGGRALIGAARDLLSPGGRLFVVANRHLAHHVTMRRIFGRCDVVASNPKFVVLESRTRAPA